MRWEQCDSRAAGLMPAVSPRGIVSTDAEPKTLTCARNMHHRKGLGRAASSPPLVAALLQPLF